MYSFVISICALLLIITVTGTADSTTENSLNDIKFESNKDFSITSNPLEEIKTATNESTISSKALNSTNASKTSSSLDDVKISSNSLDDVKLATNKSYTKTLSSLDDVRLSTTISKIPKNTKKSESSSDYDIDYEGDDDDELVYDNDSGGSGRNVTRQRHIYIMKRVGITYAWGRWGKWSRCTSSCVQIRKRQCIKRQQNSTNAEAVESTFYPDLSEKITGCLGIMKKYRLCKDEKCIKSANSQLRNERCSAYNRVPYKGKFYNWLGYEKEHNECELYCKQMDSDIFISMNQSVTDGTPCGKPAIYYTHYYRRKAVCVEGICKGCNDAEFNSLWAQNQVTHSAFQVFIQTSKLGFDAVSESISIILSVVSGDFTILIIQLPRENKNSAIDLLRKQARTECAKVISREKILYEQRLRAKVISAPRGS